MCAYFTEKKHMDLFNTMEYYSSINTARIKHCICNNTDGPWKYHAKQSPMEKKNVFTNMWDIK